MITEKEKKRRRPAVTCLMVESPLPSTAYRANLTWNRVATSNAPYQIALEQLAKSRRQPGGEDPVLAINFTPEDWDRRSAVRQSIRNAAKRMKFVVTFALNPPSQMLVRIVEAPE